MTGRNLELRFAGWKSQRVEGQENCANGEEVTRLRPWGEGARSEVGLREVGVQGGTVRAGAQEMWLEGMAFDPVVTQFW